jgi:hypothetical protein
MEYVLYGRHRLSLPGRLHKRLSVTRKSFFIEGHHAAVVWTLNRI